LKLASKFFSKFFSKFVLKKFVLRKFVLRMSAKLAVWTALPLLRLPAWTQGPVPIGELFASEANGQKTVQLAGSGMNVVSGSELSAGIAPATLKLFRGGEVRICPRTGLSVSAGGHGLMLAAGAGALEVNYQLTPDSADVLITPDFNVTLVGPGTFHFAIEVNKKGDTCFKPLPGNASEITFSELLGTEIYKTKAEEAAFFPGGKLQQHTAFTGECGCPPALPIHRAEAPAAPPPQVDNAPKPVERVAVATNAPAEAVPPERPGQVHVQVDTPFVFSAKSARPYSVAKLQVSTLPNVFFVQELVDPIVLTEKPPEVSLKTETEAPRPAEKPKPEKKGFLGRVKGFFGSLFHR
jgi:hypothetical protein